MACFDAIIVILARPTMPCIHLVIIIIFLLVKLYVREKDRYTLIEQSPFWDIL